MLPRAPCTQVEDVGDEGDSSLGCSPLTPGRQVHSAGENPERLWNRAVPNLNLLYGGCPGPKLGRSVG